VGVLLWQLVTGAFPLEDVDFEAALTAESLLMLEGRISPGR
jgi:hypothetical protein